MIVVDSSVWIDFFGGRQTPQTMALTSLMGEKPLLVGDIILCELLQGARNEENARALEKALRKFEIVPMLGETIAIAAAGHHRKLRGKGITVRKTIDLIIGAFCIASGHNLLHADRDFDPMEKHLGLKVVPAGWMVHDG